MSDSPTFICFISEVVIDPELRAVEHIGQFPLSAETASSTRAITRALIDWARTAGYVSPVVLAHDPGERSCFQLRLTAPASGRMFSAVAGVWRIVPTESSTEEVQRC